MWKKEQEQWNKHRIASHLAKKKYSLIIIIRVANKSAKQYQLNTPAGCC